MSMNAPRAARRPIDRILHHDRFADPYEWLRDRNDADVLDLIAKENAYTDHVLAPLAPLADEIFTEIKNRTQETDVDVPVLHNGYWYYSRTQVGEQYPIWARVRDAGRRPTLDTDEPIADEEILIDGPALAANAEFFKIGGWQVSRDNRTLAYLVDTSGNELFSLVIKDLSTGTIVDEQLSEVFYGIALSVDATQVYYVRSDAAWRPHQVWRHVIGTDREDDQLIYQEDDERFWLSLEPTTQGDWIVISLGSSTTGEVHLLDARDPEATTQLVRARMAEVFYTVDVASDHLLVVHNRDHLEFEVARAPLSNPGAWERIFVGGPGQRITEVEAFATHAVVSMRSEGVTTLQILPYRDGEYGAAWEVPCGGEIHTIATDANPQWDTTVLRYSYESMLTPARIMEIDIASGEVSLLKQQPVLGGYDPDDYLEWREWVTARDGTKIPVSLAARKDVQADGSNPMVLYGYGAYEVSADPYFSIPYLSLLDRGIIFAIAHVRGGGEMGRQWYLDGKLEKKTNSFTDFVDVGEEMIARGWAEKGRLAAYGGSAGGLLMGAVTNLAPELWCAVHARVPFVDALTTIANPELPLTVGEWEEWGNPLEDQHIYRLMRSYSPYENIQAVKYPTIFASTSFNDIRVFFVEPLKWVQELRHTTLNDPEVNPICFRCHMVAGHGGQSGRYDKWRETAEWLAFFCRHLHATKVQAI
ncbi:MAG: S9 family peptidase [Bowdeniella nasicola]|nr:S9 family peptidase [Bowdeniella nasicola]